MLRWLGRNGASLVLALGLTLALGGCGDDNWQESPPPQPPSEGGGTPPPASGETGLTVELAGEPGVAYVAPRTTVVVQFIVRRPDGTPVDPSEVAVEMLVDGVSIDNESVLEESSQELAASVLYGLVLDASGSMLQHSPPAFEPMKEAARKSVQDGLDLWQGREGTFSWDVCWFNDFLFHRQGPWSPADILSIPPPPLDAATKLYAATQFMAGRMAEAHGEGTASGPRDHHVLVILSDGADNLSWFGDAATAPPETRTTSTNAAYTRFGWEATELADVLESIRAHPRLTVHVLAMGSEFRGDDLDKLRDIAQAGQGRFLENPSSEATGQLFERVTREFSTLQTRGASIPQLPDDYTFTLRVQGTAGVGEQTFRYRAGPEAQLLP
ncbi:MAG: hypothetical protein ACNA8S_07355 [Deferrisomatales bacterium]